MCKCHKNVVTTTQSTSLLYFPGKTKTASSVVIQPGLSLGPNFPK